MKYIFILLFIKKIYNTNTPVINSFAVLYYDDHVHKAYILINVDLSKEDEDNSDTITLVRYKNYEDKLIKILTDTSRIELTYDDAKDKRLSNVETYDLQTDILTQESDMIYRTILIALV